LPEGAQKGILHDLERSFSTPSTTPFFPNRNILCPILLLGCRKYVAKNTLACQVFSRYWRKMLLKYVEKHLVTNRAAIPSIYLGASATPSNTRIIQREKERDKEDNRGGETSKGKHQREKKKRKRKKENKDVKSSYDASGDGWCRIRERKPPQEMVIRALPQHHPQGLCAGCPSSHTW